MKREDVKNKIPGITEEQLNWLMQENGSDITREKFLSTLSLRRATFLFADHIELRAISIHALLAESDLRCWEPPTPGPSHFYPRSPCGERPFLTFLQIRVALFLSTLSLRRATAKFYYFACPFLISIHALLAESDWRK